MLIVFKPPGGCFVLAWVPHPHTSQAGVATAASVFQVLFLPWFQLLARSPLPASPHRALANARSDGRPSFRTGKEQRQCRLTSGRNGYAWRTV
jgi:hypothetical protein